MKLVFLPTLTDIQDMLGENLYVDLIWMSRERDHASLKQQRFATWASKFSAWNAGGTPEPLYAPMESFQIGETVLPQTNTMHSEAPQNPQTQSVQELTDLLDRARASETAQEYPPRAAAAGGQR